MKDRGPRAPPPQTFPRLGTQGVRSALGTKVWRPTTTLLLQPKEGDDVRPNVLNMTGFWNGSSRTVGAHKSELLTPSWDSCVARHKMPHTLAQCLEHTTRS